MLLDYMCIPALFGDLAPTRSAATALCCNHRGIVPIRFRTTATHASQEF